ncbi:putative Sterigmatocystin biosynthesis monooxygenase [Triangularia setosa]|uniref:Sterigmatocystin biosynthesis monooxygenase n=1 Tax=Triangularia setosa TaxID=2587417 RepID=A0AAN6VWH9_9PEZI|nr:putative Sterigmatocystin biosynthesis monooxygenase [Podospora setosa]
MNSTTPSHGYRIKEAPLGSPRPFRVVCIGAGYSGLLLSIIVSQKMQEENLEYQVYEMNGDLGGKWLVNRYPGCQCDTPAHIYSYSFCPNPHWSSYYATAPSIHHYLKATAAKYDCERYVKYKHKVTSAVWNEESGQWYLKILDMAKGIVFGDRCNVLVNATGFLQPYVDCSSYGTPKWPNINGMNRFKGQLVHSALWDESVQVADKNVAMIGIGSSGVQILPEVAKEAKTITLFARSPTWITSPPSRPSPSSNQIVDEDNNYPASAQLSFETNPDSLLAHRRDLANERNGTFKASGGGRSPRSEAQEACRKSMERRLQIETSEKGRRIAQRLIPNFSVGCRRVTPSKDFLEALLDDKVDCVFMDPPLNQAEAGLGTSIKTFTELGIMLERPEDKGGKEELHFDVVICATGYEASYIPSFNLVGRDGVTLSEKWSGGHKGGGSDPESYLGTTVSGFPNYFSFLGPNSPVANGGLVQAIQAQGMYIHKCVRKLQTQGIKSMEVKWDVMDEYNEHTQAYLRGSMWTEECRSWYKREGNGEEGKVIGIYPGSAFHFVEMMRHPRWEDYKFDYSSSDVGGGQNRRLSRLNRFTFMGNGFTRREDRGESIGDTCVTSFDEYWGLMELPWIYE